MSFHLVLLCFRPVAVGLSLAARLSQCSQQAPLPTAVCAVLDQCRGGAARLAGANHSAWPRRAGCWPLSTGQGCGGKCKSYFLASSQVACLSTCAVWTPCPSLPNTPLRATTACATDSIVLAVSFSHVSSLLCFNPLFSLCYISVFTLLVSLSSPLRMLLVLAFSPTCSLSLSFVGTGCWRIHTAESVRNRPASDTV